VPGPQLSRDPHRQLFIAFDEVGEHPLGFAVQLDPIPTLEDLLPDDA
jgi:hypothetical protein